MKPLTLTLPWPPTVNTYWRKNGRGIYISKKGLLYAKEVMLICLPYRGLFKECEKLKVHIEAYPPDKRKRDLDNLFKSLLDALEKSGVFKDDRQIDALSIERMKAHENKLIVHMSRLV